MTQQGVRRTADQVLALAPDEASRKAAGRLGVAAAWSGTGQDGGTAWGLCGGEPGGGGAGGGGKAGRGHGGGGSGGGGRSYRTVVDVAGGASGPAYWCSCPSRKVPCKHALGLLLLWAEEDGAFPPGRPPDWAARGLSEWRTPERGRDAHEGETERGNPAGEAGSGRGAASSEAARRRAERRAERITAGVTELEQRLADLLRTGLAGAERSGYGLWEETAARMVDAQAAGLASRVRELGAIPSSGPDWPVRLLEETALLHLLNRAWLRRECLPEGLAATVRARTGLPATPSGPPVPDRWLVLAQYDTPDSRLTTRRVWLYGTRSHRTALVLSYGAAGRAPELTLPVGLALEAEVSPYPGGAGHRVALGERFTAPAETDVRPRGGPTSHATARYGEALRDDPWLESVPVTLDRVVPARDGDTWQLADADEDSALPLTPAARARPGLWRLVALSGGTPVTVFGECGHQGFTPLTAWPEKGGPAVPLH